MRTDLRPVYISDGDELEFDTKEACLNHEMIQKLVKHCDKSSMLTNRDTSPEEVFTWLLLHYTVTPK